MPAVVPLLPRRTALALGTLGLAAVAGCDLDPRASGPPAPGGTNRPPEDPDAALVDRVVARITAVAPTVAGVPALADLHAAHLAALGATPDASETPSASPSAPTGSVRATERALHAELTDAAWHADSGDLARVLASMAAAISQQLATLPGGVR